MYCAIPLPCRNGRYAPSRSRVRQPSIVVSSVTTIAPHPHRSARVARLSTSSSDRLQYSWNQCGESSRIRARPSIGFDAWLENTIVVPMSRAARATAQSDSAWASSSTPTGREQERALQAAARTARRWCRAARRRAASAARSASRRRRRDWPPASVRSPRPRPRRRTPRVACACFAAVSSRSASSGTRGRRPLTPSR